MFSFTKETCLLYRYLFSKLCKVHKMLLETSLAEYIFDLHVPVFRIILMTSQASYPIQIPQIYNSVKQKKKDKKCNTAPSIMKEKSSNIKSK